MLLRLLFLALLALWTPARAQEVRTSRGPIIDVHLHGGPGQAESRFYSAPPGVALDSAFLAATLREMDRYGVVLALTSMREPERLAGTWREAAPGRIIVGPNLSWNTGWPDTTWARQEYAAGRFGVVGELNYVHLGLPPSDPRVEVWFALAHQFDVPVGVHIGHRRPEISPPGCCSDSDHANGNPDLLRPILDRYPDLRLYLMHVGGRHYTEEAIALMRDYPNVYADMSVVALRAPREVFHANLRRLAEEGLLERVMFGSDGADLLGAHIEALEAVPFLSTDEKRDIFYHNAARFLRLSPAEVRRHHGR